MNFKKVFLTVMFIAIAGTAVMAQETTATPYAGVRYFIGAYAQDKNMPGGKDIDLANTLVNTSRLGVNFSKGNLSGKAEIGLGPGHAGVVATRHIYAQYAADSGLTVLVGQTDLPWYMPLSNEAFDIHGGPGTSQADRTPQIKISYQGFYLIAAKYYGTTPPNQNFGYYPALYDDKDLYMPLTGIGYDLKSEMLDLGVGFAGYKQADKTAGAQDVVAYIGYVHGTAKLGDMFIRFNAAYEKAPMLLGLTQGQPMFRGSNGTPTGHLLHSVLADTEKATDHFVEGMLEFGYKLPMGVFTASIGYQKNITTDLDGSADRMGIGAQMAINVYPGFAVVPTIFYLDELQDKDGNAQGADLLAGIQFRADF